MFHSKNLQNVKSRISGSTRVADAVSALPFTTEFQVKPGRTEL